MPEPLRIEELREKWEHGFEELRKFEQEDAKFVLLKKERENDTQYALHRYFPKTNATGWRFSCDFKTTDIDNALVELSKVLQQC